MNRRETEVYTKKSLHSSVEVFRRELLWLLTQNIWFSFEAALGFSVSVTVRARTWRVISWRKKKKEKRKDSGCKTEGSSACMCVPPRVPIRSSGSRARNPPERFLSHSVKRKRSTWWLISLITFMWNGCQMTTAGNQHSLDSIITSTYTISQP